MRTTTLMIMLFATAPLLNAVAGAGFFRVGALPDGRDTLLDGQGAPFFVRGVDHVQFKGHWCAALKKFPHREWNETRYSSEEAWRVETVGRLKKWGFNTLTGVPDEGLLHRGLAHTETLGFGRRICQKDGKNDPDAVISRSFPNVFSSDFASRCDAWAKERCGKLRDDKTLVGYFLDNELPWWGNTPQSEWPSFVGMYDVVAALPPEHTARKALEMFRCGRPKGESLDETKAKFLELVAERYFSTCVDAVRRHDPDHLILGCRFASFVGAAKCVWQTAAKWCDVLSVNCYPFVDFGTGRMIDRRDGDPIREVFDRHHAWTKRPLMVTEWSVIGLDSGLPCKRGCGQRVKTQAERAKAAEMCARFFMSCPYVVGYDWFMWVDEPALGISEKFPEDSNYGLINERAEPYQELVEMFTRLHNAASGVVASDEERASVRLFAPKDSRIANLAAETFAGLWERVTGIRPEICGSFPDSGDVVVFGEERENPCTFKWRLDGRLPPNTLRNGSDSYRILSRKDGDRTVLFLLNARPRSLLYAVYRFFELRADCAWFWDCDRIPKGMNPDIGGLDVAESPRFDWRGLRYFAHRSLHRFQAEHWTLEDWKREIDWMVKRRLNFFMLRIGQDDLFQRAFPEIMQYDDGSWDPVGGKPDHFYNDRSLMWPLKTRAALRKAVMDYAHERDLVHCADTGTMTHWYSRTPKAFLERAKPEFLAGNNDCDPMSSKGNPSCLVWDIANEKWLDAYWKITQADVDSYSGADMFHTIGLAERSYYGDDDEKNFRLKLSTYRSIIGKLREHYPNAPLLVGSWDFREYWRWTPERVRSFVDTLDPSNTIVFDYISDLPEAKLNLFTQWGVVGKFPWMFGIFHAYEAQNDMRGNYPQIRERFPVAAEDPMCKGVFMWAENSHQDTLMLDYFGAIGWNPEEYRLETFLPGFCRRRYGEAKSTAMLALWRRMAPVLPADSWHLCVGAREPLYGDYPAAYANITATPFCCLDERRLRCYRDREKALSPLRDGMLSLLGDLAAVDLAGADERVRRDSIDMARAVLGRLLEGDVARLGLAIDARRRLRLSSPDAEKSAADALIRRHLASLRKNLHGLADVLESSPEFSLSDSLDRIRAAGPSNPVFEKTLKANANNSYCRSQIYELIRHCNERQVDALSQFLESAMASEDGFAEWESRAAELDMRLNAPSDTFNARPIEEMKPDYEAAFARLSQVLRTLSSASENSDEGALPRAATPKSCIGMKRSWDPYPGWWERRHEEKLAEIAASGGEIDLVFVGDSITHNWEGARGPGSAYGGKPLAELKKRYSVLNLGFGGDTTRNVLWRLENGEMDGYKAKCVMLMIGTNNGGTSAEDTAAGVKAILDLIALKQPQAVTILLPIFPSGATAGHPWRKSKEKVNALIRKFADGKKVVWHDFNSRFLNPDGTFPNGMMMKDDLHPLAPGYEIWAEEVAPIFRKVCGK